MKIKETVRVAQIFIIAFLFSECCSKIEKEAEIWPPPKNNSISFELINKDTCNRLVYGYKQNLWYILDSAKLRLGERVIKDTLYYRNDTVVEK